MNQQQIARNDLTEWQNNIQHTWDQDVHQTHTGEFATLLDLLHHYWSYAHHLTEMNDIAGITSSDFLVKKVKTLWADYEGAKAAVHYRIGNCRY